MEGFAAIHVNAAMQELMFRSLALVKPPASVAVESEFVASNLDAIGGLCAKAATLLEQTGYPAESGILAREGAALVGPPRETGLRLAGVAQQFATHHGATLDERIFDEARSLLQVPYEDMRPVEREALADLGASTQIHERYPLLRTPDWRFDAAQGEFPGQRIVREGRLAELPEQLLGLRRSGTQARFVEQPGGAEAEVRRIAALPAEALTGVERTTLTDLLAVDDALRAAKRPPALSEPSAAIARDVLDAP